MLTPLIPTDDPAAALRFCRLLASALSESPDNTTPTASSGPVLSIVVPIFDEQDTIPQLYSRLIAVLQAGNHSFEIVFVDDGSRDGSLALLHSLAAQDPRVVLVELARNFGHQAAISAGLDQAIGDAVIVMDGDLQDPPEVLPQMIAKWQEGYQVAYAVRQQRKERWPLRAAYAAFYRGLRRLASIDVPIDAGDFCIMDRQVVDVLCAMPERNRFVRGLRSWVGFSQVGVPYERQARYAGRSKYGLRRLTALAVDGMLSFSRMPLHFVTLMGFGISLLSLALAIFYLVKRVVFGLSPPGFPTLVVAILFLSGVQLVTLGLIGEYVGRISDEVKQRPLYVVRRIRGNRAVGRAAWYATQSDMVSQADMQEKSGLP